jgi:hypothetical protein
VVEMIDKRRFVLVIVVASMVTIGIIFATNVMWVELSWNIEVGDSFTYNVVSYDDYIENNTKIIANITALPQYWIIKSAKSFTSSIIEVSKVEVFFENGSELGGYDYYFRMLLSKTILPCGEWDLLDSLYVDPEDTSFGPTSVLSGYISKLESDYFLLGHEAVDFDSSSGWNAHISLETGLPFYFQYWKYDQFDPITNPLIFETRVTLEMYLIS